jgi:hypothetical protein
MEVSTVDIYVDLHSVVTQRKDQKYLNASLRCQGFVISGPVLVWSLLCFILIFLVLCLQGKKAEDSKCWPHCSKWK